MIQQIILLIVPSLLLVIAINFFLIKTNKKIDIRKYKKRSMQVCLLIVGLNLTIQIIVLIDNMREMNNPDAMAVSFDIMYLLNPLIWTAAVISTQVIINKTLLKKICVMRQPITARKTAMPGFV
jgi:hypothetical protein